MKRTKFPSRTKRRTRPRPPTFKRTQWSPRPYKIFHRSSRGRKWKAVKKIVVATSKRHAAFIASKYLTGRWIRPVQLKINV